MFRTDQKTRKGIAELIAVQLVLAVALLLCSPQVTGDNPDVDKIYAIDIPQSNADQALKTLAHQTGVQVLVPFDLVKAIDTRPISGNYSVMTALAVLLFNTGLSGILTDSGVITISLNGSEYESNQNGKGKSMNITNSTKRKTLLAGLVGVFAAGGMTQAVAQGGEAATGQSAIDEIIVTANKREQSLQDVAMSVSALSGEDMASRGIESFEDLGLAVPGISVSDSAFGRNVYIRGVSNLFGNSPLVGVYVDEVPASGARGRAPDINTYDLERVEVLRGPQGTLYGQGSMGGTLRFITKAPELDRVAYKVDLAPAVTKDGEFSSKVQAVVNIPLQEDKLGIRIAGSFEEEGGWIDQPTASKTNINDQEVMNLRTKVLWRPTEALDISLMADIHRNDIGSRMAEDDEGNFTQALGSLETPSKVDDFDIYNLTLSYDLGAVQFVSVSSYMEDRTEGKNQKFVFPFAPPPTTPFLGVIDHFLEGDTFSQELRLSSKGSEAFQWTVGSFYRDSETLQHYPFFALNEQETTTSWAVFGDASYDLTDRLKLGAGIRYFEDEREHFDKVAVLTQKDTFTSVDPRIYANYDVTPTMKAYASISSGFRSGGFNTQGRAEL